MFGGKFDPMAVIGGTPFNVDAYNLGIPAEVLMQQAQQQVIPEQKKPGLFGKGGAFWDFLGYAGDSITGKPMYTNHVQQRRQGEQQERQYQRQRQDKREDQEWEWKNRPREPHRWEANDGSLMEMDPATGQPRVVYQDPTPKINWMQVQTPRGLEIIPVGPNGPLTGQAGQSGSSQADMTPTVEDGYQYRPGPGGRANKANWQPVGGATAGPSQTFR